MKKTVLVALENQVVYQALLEHLENEDSTTELEISQNIESLATFLYFLPKVNPDMVMVSERVLGDYTPAELEIRIRELSPATETFIYRDEFHSFSTKILDKTQLLQKIVAVWSPSGGVGKTEIAKNLALVAGSSYRVILFDANLCNPDIAEHLGIGYQSGHTLSAAYALWAENLLTPANLRNVLLPYEKIQVLVGSEDAIEQTDYSPAFFRDLMRALSQLADFLIVDMDSDITSPAGISILLASHHVLTPFNTITSTLGHGKVYMDLLQDSYQMDATKFDPILNRLGEGGTVSAEDIEIYVKRPVMATIPYHKAHLRATCRQKPLILGKEAAAKKLFRTLQQVIQQYALQANKEVRPS